MFQSMVEGRYVPWDLLVKDVPKEKAHDLEFLVDMLDWEANVDPEFGQHNMTKPRPVRNESEMADAGYRELWVTYGTRYYSAKELTVLPKRSVVIKDAAAYGLILTQGFGKLGVHTIETPALIRFGELTNDELFVSAEAAIRGVEITNASDKEPLVILKHFGPGNPDAASLIIQ
jgi:hypothetical protein